MNDNKDAKRILQSYESFYIVTTKNNSSPYDQQVYLIDNQSNIICIMNSIQTEEPISSIYESLKLLIISTETFHYVFNKESYQLIQKMEIVDKEEYI